MTSVGSYWDPIVLISTAMIGTLDYILTSSGKERDSG